MKLAEHYVGKIKDFADRFDLVVDFREFVDDIVYCNYEVEVKFYSAEKKACYLYHLTSKDRVAIGDQIEIMKKSVLQWLGHDSKNEGLEEKDSTKTKENQRRQERIDELVEAAKVIMQNAESIIGTEKYCTDITVTIYIRPDETTINIDKNSLVICEDKEE